MLIIRTSQDQLGNVVLLGKARRGMLRRAVFSDIQRKGLERRFQVQKYISKPDRKKLADQLGLKDSQVRNTKVAKWKENEIVHKISNPDKFSILNCARCFKAVLPMFLSLHSKWISQNYAIIKSDLAPIIHHFSPSGQNLVPEPSYEVEEQQGEGAAVPGRN